MACFNCRIGIQVAVLLIHHWLLLVSARKKFYHKSGGNQGSIQEIHGRTRGPKCRYSFVVNEVDSSKCPMLFQRGENPVQNDNPSIMQRTYLRGMEDLTKKFHDLEDKFQSQTAVNNDLKRDILSQKQWMRKVEQTVESLGKNFTRLFANAKDIKTTLTKQKAYMRSLDSKLVGTMLDMVEVSESLSSVQRNQVVTGVSKKNITVQAASAILSCGLSHNATRYRDCDEVYQHGHLESGVYYITPSYSSCPIPIYCDMTTPPGGWLVIQRRQDGALNFNHNWDEYRHGFGDVTKEFWLGNDNIFLLSNQHHYKLRVDLWDFYGSRVYAEYGHFKLDGDRDRYKLHVLNHTGTAPDGLGHHNGVYFSTPDRDHDLWPEYHCAKEWQAGWWFNNCWFVILNGQYYNTTRVKYRGISWNDWKAEQLQKVEMKIRPART